MTRVRAPLAVAAPPGGALRLVGVAGDARGGYVAHGRLEGEPDSARFMDLLRLPSS